MLTETTIQPSQTYVNEKGTEYVVLAVPNLNSTRTDFAPMVVYQGEDGEVWCRPLEVFENKMRLVQKKEQIEDDAAFLQVFMRQLVFYDFMGDNPQDLHNAIRARTLVHSLVKDGTL